LVSTPVIRAVTGRARVPSSTTVVSAATRTCASPASAVRAADSVTSFTSPSTL
jgi:hypothetical protein